jgi:hypothetical protein
MIIFQTVTTMTQDNIPTEIEQMWNEIRANYCSEELKLIEIPKHCTGFAILTEHDHLEVILIKERTRGQGPYRQAMSLKKGLNFTCLCNIRAESPNTRIFIDNKDHIFQLTKNDHVPHLLVLKRKKRGSRISGNISDIAWQYLGDHQHTLQMIGTNITWPYDDIPSCTQNHCWRDIV